MTTDGPEPPAATMIEAALHFSAAAQAIRCGTDPGLHVHEIGNAIRLGLAASGVVSLEGTTIAHWFADRGRPTPDPYGACVTLANAIVHLDRLDAARALHDVLLPGHACRLVTQGAAEAEVECDGLRFAATACCASAAWAVATLDAKATALKAAVRAETSTLPPRREQPGRRLLDMPAADRRLAAQGDA